MATREQAEINRDNKLHAVFIRLADDELSHAKILEDKIKGLPYKPSIVGLSVEHVFDDMGIFKP
ncbi:MAG TPA: hypothetical protein PLZ84_06510 [Clostridia bacterium]|nr:hypothetical protein [Clostridia bacterium]